MKIDSLACILKFVCTMNFWSGRKAKNEFIDFSGQTCVKQGYFIYILYVDLVLEKFQLQLCLFWVKIS